MWVLAAAAITIGAAADMASAKTEGRIIEQLSTSAELDDDHAAARQLADATHTAGLRPPSTQTAVSPNNFKHRYQHHDVATGRLTYFEYEAKRHAHVFMLDEDERLTRVKCAEQPQARNVGQREGGGGDAAPSATATRLTLTFATKNKETTPNITVGTILVGSEKWSCGRVGLQSKQPIRDRVIAPPVLTVQTESATKAAKALVTIEVYATPVEFHECFETATFEFFHGSPDKLHSSRSERLDSFARAGLDPDDGHDFADATAVIESAMAKAKQEQQQAAQTSMEQEHRRSLQQKQKEDDNAMDTTTTTEVAEDVLAEPSPPFRDSELVVVEVRPTTNATRRDHDSTILPGGGRDAYTELSIFGIDCGTNKDLWLSGNPHTSCYSYDPNDKYRFGFVPGNTYTIGFKRRNQLVPSAKYIFFWEDDTIGDDSCGGIEGRLVSNPLRRSLPDDEDNNSGGGGGGGNKTDEDSSYHLRRRLGQCYKVIVGTCRLASGDTRCANRDFCCQDSSDCSAYSISISSMPDEWIKFTMPDLGDRNRFPNCYDSFSFPEYYLQIRDRNQNHLSADIKFRLLQKKHEVKSISLNAPKNDKIQSDGGALTCKNCGVNGNGAVHVVVKTDQYNPFAESWTAGAVQDMRAKFDVEASSFQVNRKFSMESDWKDIVKLKCLPYLCVDLTIAGVRMKAGVLAQLRYKTSIEMTVAMSVPIKRSLLVDGIFKLHTKNANFLTKDLSNLQWYNGGDSALSCDDEVPATTRSSSSTTTSSSSPPSTSSSFLDSISLDVDVTAKITISALLYAGVYASVSVIGFGADADAYVKFEPRFSAIATMNFKYGSKHKSGCDSSSFLYCSSMCSNADDFDTKLTIRAETEATLAWKFYVKAGFMSLWKQTWGNEKETTKSFPSLSGKVDIAQVCLKFFEDDTNIQTSGDSSGGAASSVSSSSSSTRMLDKPVCVDDRDSGSSSSSSPSSSKKGGDVSKSAGVAISVIIVCGCILFGMYSHFKHRREIKKRREEVGREASDLSQLNG